MAPGFWSKLADFGKKAWSGIKKGAQYVAKAIPVAQTVLGTIGAATGGTPVGAAAQGIGKGLGFLNPIVNYIADS